MLKTVFTSVLGVTIASLNDPVSHKVPQTYPQYVNWHQLDLIVNSLRDGEKVCCARSYHRSIYIPKFYWHAAAFRSELAKLLYVANINQQ